VGYQFQWIEWSTLFSKLPCHPSVFQLKTLYHLVLCFKHSPPYTHPVSCLSSFFSEDLILDLFPRETHLDSKGKTAFSACVSYGYAFISPGRVGSISFSSIDTLGCALAPLRDWPEHPEVWSCFSLFTACHKHHSRFWESKMTPGLA
jgi:hypothetical protein